MASSRESILAAIRRNRPAAVPLPEPAAFALDGDLAAAFTSVVEAIGGRVVAGSSADLPAAVRAAFPDAATVASTVPDVVEGAVDLGAVDDPHDLAAVDLFVCRAGLGVAENGAVWLREADVVHRAAPFITQHLAVVLDRSAIVGTMHEAYELIRLDETGFGVFVAGPSKTADIEQSLVIGAHGARSLTVFLL